MRRISRQEDAAVAQAVESSARMIQEPTRIMSTSRLGTSTPRRTTSPRSTDLVARAAMSKARKDNGIVADRTNRPQGRRRPRRRGGATSDAQRRALAKAHARPDRPARPIRPGWAVLCVDGGARGTPGPAAIGYFIEDDAGIRLAEHAQAIGTTTAAEAEYRALLAGLARAHVLGLTRITARSDSKLLIAHANGERLIRNARLLSLGAEISEWRMRIGTVHFEWVPAAANREAHQLVADVLAQPPE